MVGRTYLLAPLLLGLILLSGACAELELLTGGSRGGPGPPPSGSLSVSFIDVGQGDGVLVQAGGEDYLIDAGRPEEGPNVVDFLRSRGVKELDGIVVSNPDADHIGSFLHVFDAFEVETVYVSGDAEAREEEYMAGGPYTGPLTLLKVTHHGSSTSSTPLFLSRFPSKIAVIQCGADNPYGHPTPEVLSRLHRTGARVFRNDEHGDVIVTIKDQRVEVAVTKPGSAF